MKRRGLKQLDLKHWIKQPRRVPSVIQIIPNGCITVGHGETVTIEANFSTQSKEPFTAIWQKLEDGVPRDLILDTDNYNGSSCDLTDLKLVIKNTDHKDAGHYRIEIRSSTESVTSQQVTVRVFGEYPSSLSKAEVNFLLIYLLCQDIGTKAVRILFDRCVPAPTLSAHLQKYKADFATGNYKLQIQKCTSDQWSTLFPAGPAGTVSSEKFDLTLLYLLVRSTVNIPRPTQGWGTKPLPSHTRESDDLERIKQWRNTVVHAKVAETKDSEFNSTWDELSKAINRLSKGHLKTEVDELCNKFKCPTTEILDCINHVKEGLKKQKEETQQIENRVTEIEEVRHIPKHIRETHLKMIQKWKEEDTVFTEETQLFDSAWNAVVSDSNVNIIFVGGTGSGKTATARHIALKLEQTSDYEIVPVSNPEEISRYTNIRIKQVFLLDDVLGTFSVDMNRFSSMESIKTHIETMAHPSKVILTCRRTVYNDAQGLHTFITDNCVDLESVENKLTVTENIRIMNKYGINDNFLNQLSNIIVQSNRQVSPMFPLLCKLFAKDPIYGDDGVEFFFKPVHYLLEELDRMRRMNRDNYATLILCILNGNAIFQDTHLSRDLTEEVYNTCGLSLSSPDSNINDAILRMDGTYLTYNGSYYTCIHDSIFEIAAYHYGKQFPKLIIKYMSSDYVSNKIKVDNTVQGKDLCIKIERNQFMYLAERLYADIQSMKLYDVLSNPALKFLPFLDTFIELLELKSYKELANLFLSLHSIERFYIPSNKFGLHVLQLCYILYIDEYSSNPKSRVIRWIILFGHSKLFKYFVASTRKQNEIQRLFDLDMFENTRLLALACVSKNKDTIALILQNVCKASITGITSNGRMLGLEYCPLHIACVIGDLDIVELLIKELDHDGIYYINDCYPLCAAAEHGHYDVVQFLLDKGTDINRATGKQNTPLYLASYHGHTRIVEFLLKKGALPNVGCSPLWAACQCGNIDIVKMLVEGGMDINKMDLSKGTPLSYASQKGEYNIVKFLEENRANKEGQTPLYQASYWGHTRIVQYLLENGALTDVGCSPLSGACQSKNIDIVRMLVESGIDINKMDRVNQTPVYYATDEGEYDVVKYLVENRANVNLTNKAEETPLYQASYLGHTRIVQYLLKNGALTDVGCSPLCGACQGGNIDIVKMLVDGGIDINKMDLSDQTPLYYASEQGQYDIVKYLVENGADINITNKEGETPLYLASHRGHTIIVQYLLKNGALTDVGAVINITNKEGETLLYTRTPITDIPE